MMDCTKYEKQYFMPPTPTFDWVKKEKIEKAPIWCSVDLRDGNQALIEPMSLEEKLEFFQMLVKVGFKEIEVGFPAASETEYNFMRALIERNMIPDDVTVQVLTQAREHIIKKTFEAVKGCKHAVIHLYNSTSVAQREQVFKKSKEQIKKIAVDGAKLLKELADEVDGNFSFEYSPESFTGTEVDYALEVCNAVLDVWQPKPDNKVIINLPATVENSLPHVFATQIEYMHKNLKYRDAVTISLHPHNDRGCGVSDAELGLLAGADRIEGTLFGNGERTGNVDIITLAMNMFSHGVDPKLDFSDMPHICETYEKLTRMKVSPRQPYAGDLVFTAFSGSHQDAIAKGMTWREEHDCQTWTVPYLPIDPQDVGRRYDSDVIRINSQSGKGGVSYIMENKYGYTLPKPMLAEFSSLITDMSDEKKTVLTNHEIHQAFKDTYVNVAEPIKTRFYRSTEEDDCTILSATIEKDGKVTSIEGKGNGPLDALCNGLRQFLGQQFEICNYTEHALTRSSNSRAATYIEINDHNHHKTYWGAGVDANINTASIYALISAVNRMLADN